MPGVRRAADYLRLQLLRWCLRVNGLSWPRTLGWPVAPRAPGLPRAHQTLRRNGDLEDPGRLRDVHRREHVGVANRAAPGNFDDLLRTWFVDATESRHELARSHRAAIDPIRRPRQHLEDDRVGRFTQAGTQ